MQAKSIQIHTDGACLGNPGPGGFGIIIDVDGEERRFGGGEADTTNNRMELTAALTAIQIVKSLISDDDTAEIILHTDSKYVTDAFNQDWITGWRTKNWWNANGKPIKNQDLWKEMIEEVKPLNVTFQWVKGHSGDPANEVCDEMANEQAIKYINSEFAGTTPPSETKLTQGSLEIERIARAQGYEAAIEKMQQHFLGLESGSPPAFRDDVDGYRDCRAQVLEFLQGMKANILPF